MIVTRRRILATGMASFLAGATSSLQAASSDPLSQITDAARLHALALRRQGGRWFGPAWERLVIEARASHFFLVGEDHGFREIPELIGDLFQVVRPAGYTAVSLEISEAAAEQIDRRLRGGGLRALRQWLGTDHGQIAFYDWSGEAQFLARVRRATPDGLQAIFGTDYEPFATRQLAERLGAIADPATARTAAERLLSRINWMRAEAQRLSSPASTFGFGGKSGELSEVKAAFHRTSPEASLILDTLEKTLTINAAFLEGRRWESNELRAEWQRTTFLRNWERIRRRGAQSRTMLKYGANHLRRGLSETETFDLGTLVPELAQTMRVGYYQLMVLGGRGSTHSVLMPDFSYRETPAEPLSAMGLALFDELARNEATLFDLRALRRYVDSHSAEKLPGPLVRTIHGFDGLLVIPAASPAQPL